MRIFCDFDGTISVKDTTDEILKNFASSEWEVIEEQWKRGEMGSAECMRRQVALINVSKETLDDALDHMPIDPTFPEFVRFCESIGAPLSIISDGVDYFIHRILNRYQLGYLPIISNRLSISTSGTYSLSSPYANPLCTSAAGVCKCRQISSNTRLDIFIGDGRSDFCAAESADLLFAKSTLATYCEQQSIRYIAYENFNDVRQALTRVLPGIDRRESTVDLYAYA